MHTRSTFAWLVAAALVAGLAVSTAYAAEGQGGPRNRGDRQGPGGAGMFGARGGFGFGGGLLGLLNVPEVKKEIELNDDQAADVTKLAEQMRNQPRPERPNFAEMSDADRQKAFEEMRKRAQEQAKQAKDKLAEILLPHQLERLEQISLQNSLRMGLANALASEELAGKLKITDDQKSKIEGIRNDSTASMREMFQGAGQGNREGLREKMEAARKETDTKVLGVLTDEQKAALEKMKGKAFEMPQGAFGRGPGQGGNRGNRQPRN